MKIERTYEHLEIHKDANEQFIDVGLVEILSAQAAWHLVTEQILDAHGYP